MMHLRRVPILLFAVLISCFYFETTVLASVEHKGKNTITPSEENFRTGMLKYKEKDVDGATDAFLQAIYFARNYYYPEAYYRLGICYMDKKTDAKAIEALNKACEQSITTLPDAHVLLAEIYLRNDRLEDANNEANLALRQYKGPGPRARNVLGMIKEKEGDLGNANSQFVDALGDKRPWRYTEAWMHLAENLMKQKEWGAAIAQFDAMRHNKVVLEGLDYEKLFLDTGICLLAKGDHQGAIDNWHECLNYNPNNAEAHLQLGMLFDAEQHYSSAIKEYQDYVRNAHDDAGVTKIKERIHVIEQKLNPAAEPSAPHPSMYMHKQRQDQEKEEQRQKENLTVPSDVRESGF